MKNFFLCVFALCMLAETTCAITAAKGVFTVAVGKQVQFANANESGLVQWADRSTPDGDGWFVLNHDEWSYLLADGRTNASDLNSEATVNGRHGIVILPDGWVQPAGVPDFNTNYMSEGYDANIYNDAQWTLMENSGAVFLPCEGYSTDGVMPTDPTIHGAYWSADQYNAEKGYSIHFNDFEIHDQDSYANKNIYYSIRKVREILTELDEEDEAAAFATKLAEADDHPSAIVRRTLKKDGTFYTLCLPFDVPDIDASPLAGAEVFTFDGGTVSGPTGNEQLHLNMSRLAGKRLSQGVPYILRWSNTGETMTRLCFYNVENWDDDTNTATDPGNETVKYHGVYPKAHIPGYETAGEAHYNFFMGANNTLYWPDDATYGEDAKMKGFRAYFYITPGGGPDAAPLRRGMQAVWHISDGFNSTTGLDNVQTDDVQCTKVIRNGQIYLMYKGQMYNVQGKKVTDF